MSVQGVVASEGRKIIVLKEGSGQVLRIDRADRDKFCVEVNDAIHACEQVSDQYRIVVQIADLQDALSDWIIQRQDRIYGAFVNLLDDGELRFVVVQQGLERDAQLSADLVDLDIDVSCSGKFDRLRMEVLSVPRTSRDSMDAFLANGEVRQHARSTGSLEGS